MSSLDDLIERAKMLHSEGRSQSQIADEMSLSVETITWLLTQQKGEKAAPKDILIDWSAISCYADMLEDISVMMLKRFYYAQEELLESDEKEICEPDVIIGIAHSGIPLATMIAGEEDCQFTMYHPKKHAQGENPAGSLNSSFANVTGKKCLIVDDVITSGNTVSEAVDYIRSHGGCPVGIVVIFDKRGIKEINDVPLYSLVKAERID
ncbi:orotate phosphoribosyltransferase-like protein [Methanoplanus sp. FWC-SCC4]|uniref:Transcriptional regulator GfcR n=1 Tax=Methanochimaera problematica TaxID=2609417 RepID=A0AA97I519_9EURY|nr:orotate phosphoribosyltransferase-like protein [Methanoplanus sp. FWC-SCC4]WOF16981.1 orotate phosphoribosyltransferase-like protein [Methanoplanus sp. FWC-SCC4]